MRRSTRTVLISCLGALALFGAGCGNRERATTEAPTEGLWLDVGALDYHIQGSRQLNPGIVPDDKYLSGMPQGVLPAGAKETYFGVFVRIENRTGRSHPTADQFQIVDTEGHVFKPLELQTNANPFAYKAATLPPEGTLPSPDSAADFDSTAGALLLFKIPLASYQNRPLELKITAPTDANAGDVADAPPEATLDLDV
jgi:hypothetical protein